MCRPFNGTPSLWFPAHVPQSGREGAFSLQTALSANLPGVAGVVKAVYPFSGQMCMLSRSLRPVPSRGTAFLRQPFVQPLDDHCHVLWLNRLRDEFADPGGMLEVLRRASEDHPYLGLRGKCQPSQR
jgi:hypothetical protein